MIEVPSLEELLKDESGRDMFWTWLQPAKGALDAERFRSNVPLRCFRTRVAARHRRRGPFARVPHVPVPPSAHDPRWCPTPGSIRSGSAFTIRRDGPRGRSCPGSPRTRSGPARTATPRSRPGRYVYLGFVLMHYGHLLTEFLSRMWFDPAMFGPETRFLVQAREEHQNWWARGPWAFRARSCR